MLDIARQVGKLGADSLLPPEFYTLKLTKTELWLIRYALGFTYPDNRSILAARIDKLYKRASR